MENEFYPPGIIAAEVVTHKIIVDELEENSSELIVEKKFFSGPVFHLEITRLKRKYRLTLNVKELDPKTPPIYWNYSGVLSGGSFSLGNPWSRVLKGRQDVSLVLKKRLIFLEECSTEMLNVIFQFVLLRETMVASSSSRRELSLRTTEKLKKDLKGLLENAEESDLTIRVENGSSEFHAHRNILRARSHVFAAALKHDLPGKRTGVLPIVKWEAETVRNFLFFLYTSYVENLTSRNAIRLYQMADKYQVEDLKELCLECIENNLKVEMIGNAFRLALKFKLQRLLEKATDFFTGHMKDIIGTDQWKGFICESPLEANKVLIQGLEAAALNRLERGKRKNGRSTSPCSSQKKIKVPPTTDENDES